jgi:hypothetical protein
MAWRLAESLAQLRDQINDAYPRRSKASDGTIGDAAHASRSSDHNPWVKDGKNGVVTGMDITHDPDKGVDAGKLAEALRSSRDARIKYVISNARICSGDSGPSPWVWRRYTGSNAHRHHVHISVKSEKHFYDSRLNWDAVDALTNGPVGFIAQPDDPGIEEGDGEPKTFWEKAKNWLLGGGGVAVSGLGWLGDVPPIVWFAIIGAGVFLVIYFNPPRWLRRRG